MHSVRLKYLETIKDKSNVPIVNYRKIDWSEIEAFYENNDVEGLAQLLFEKSQGLKMVFVHACPRDESVNREYSFAGVYKSYKPIRGLSRMENMRQAAELLINKRFSTHAEYYYVRHQLAGNKEIDIILSNNIDDIWGYGTGYVDGNGNFLLQYYKSPLSMYTKEAYKYLGNIKFVPSQDYLLKNIATALFDSRNCIGTDLDVEFVFTNQMKIYINELRPISFAHRKNWESFFFNAGQIKVPSAVRSCVIDSIGNVFGKAIVVNAERDDWVNIFASSNEYIFVVAAEDILLFLKIVNMYHGENIRLIIQYNNYIIDNHLQYIVYEDTGIEFVAKVINIPLQDGQMVGISSNGLNSTVEISIM